MLFSEDARVLVGSTISRVRLSGRGAVSFHTRKGDLTIHSGSCGGAVGLGEKREIADSNPPWGNWRRLEGARVLGVEAIRCDRILRLAFAKSNRLGEETRSVLFSELFPPRGRLVLCEDDETVLEVLPARDPDLVGSMYSIPGSRPTVCFPHADRMQLARVADGCVGEKPAEVLPRLLRGINRLLAVEVACRAGCGDVLRQEQTEALTDALCEVAESISKALDPRVIIDGDGNVIGVSPIELISIPPKLQSVRSTFAEALTEVLDLRSAEKQNAELVRRLGREARVALGRNRRAVERIEVDVETSARADEFEREGKLLVAADLPEKRGLTRATVHDYETDRDVEIKLNPKKTPKEYATLLFRKARKARDAHDKQTRRLSETRDAAARFERFLDEMDGMSSDELVEQAHSLGLSMPEQDATKRESGPFDHLPASLRPRVFVTSTGWTVLVGRSNRGNDELTRRIAHKNDVWLHARGASGSHVVIRREGRKEGPDKKTIEEAAAIAARFSRAKHSSAVPVIVTEVRYVRKPRGAPPGLAVVEREKTVMARPGLPPSPDEPEGKREK
jgi:predicted ribosome quality control (RQC) complex YloA/Tae2 family protein